MYIKKILKKLGYNKIHIDNAGTLSFIEVINNGQHIRHSFSSEYLIIIENIMNEVENGS